MGQVYESAASRSRSGVLGDPAVGVARPGDQFAGGEEQGNLALTALGAIAGVDEVAAHLEPEVATDSAGGGLRGVCRAHAVADGASGGVAFEDGSDDGAAGDVLDEAGEEGLAFVLGVVPAGEAFFDLHELETDKAQAAVLEALEDGSGEAALDGVGLDEDEGAFN